MASGQRRFAVMGDNTFRMASKLVSNQRLCRLLKYNVVDPFSEDLEDVDGTELLHKQILVVPKIVNAEDETRSFVVARFDSFIVNSMNPDFKISTVRFDIACPYNEWRLKAESLRPYLIMQEIDNMFNQGRMAGIGNLEFKNATSLVLSPQIGGYSMTYRINEFN